MRRLGAPIVSPFVRMASRADVREQSSSQDFRSTRPSFAVNYTAHVADSQRFLLQGPPFSKTSARADSQKRRSPVPFRIAGRARKQGGCQCWRFLTREALLCETALTNPKHNRAIVQEIGERLRAVLKEEPECRGSLRAQIDRLRELEGRTIIVRAAERWDKRPVEPPWTAQTVRPNMDEQCHR